MPRKKSEKKKKDSGTMLKIIGTPTMVLLPAKNYKFKVYPEEYNIIIPRKGAYKDLDEGEYTEKDGEFSILDKDILYIPSISKILFATSQYPELEDNQAFTPIALVIEKDRVQIIGNVIEMLKEE
jgi:hypothetical protein